MSVYGEQSGKEQFHEEDENKSEFFTLLVNWPVKNIWKYFQNSLELIMYLFCYFNVYGPGQNLENLKQGMVSIYLKQFLDDNFSEVIIKGNTQRFRRSYIY